ncbi:MAG TPA: DUF1801 domain-containing protein [Vicinamibacterales bacterium]|jgi:hypothetical protein|nr:DUF1801 domain-containing protein [Vicinamibacterales bacterium]
MVPVSKPPAELLEFFYRYAPAVQSLALGLRRTILDELTPCHEYIFQMRSKVVLMYGPTPRVIKDNVCAIGVFADHVTLGFHRGADLDDPGGVLQGSGKTWRHLVLKKLSELDRPELRALLRRARRQAGLKRRRPGEVVTRVKGKSAMRWPTPARPG